MKKIISLVIVGLCLIGMIGVASAAETNWTKVDLSKGNAISLEVPSGFVLKQKDMDENGQIDSMVESEDGQIRILVRKDRYDGEIPPMYSGKYPMDKWSEEKQKEFMQGSFRGNIKYRFATHKSGHRVILADQGTEKFTMKMIFVFSNGYYMGVTVGKEGVFSPQELKVVEEILDRVQF